MKLRGILSAVLGVLLACAVFLPAAHADEANQMTKLTFPQPVQLPNVTLPAGTYWFRIADLANAGNLNVVQVFNQNRSQIYDTELTIPVDRPQPRGKTEVTLAERPHNQPQALYDWFYPGRVTGHQFIYSPREQKRLRQEAKLDLLAAPTLSNRPASRP